MYNISPTGDCQSTPRKRTPNFEGHVSDVTGIQLVNLPQMCDARSVMIWGRRAYARACLQFARSARKVLRTERTQSV